jgi:hypothetical protein
VVCLRRPGSGPAIYFFFIWHVRNSDRHTNCRIRNTGFMFLLVYLLNLITSSGIVDPDPQNNCMLPTKTNYRIGFYTRTYCIEDTVMNKMKIPYRYLFNFVVYRTALYQYTEKFTVPVIFKETKPFVILRIKKN